VDNALEEQQILPACPKTSEKNPPRLEDPVFIKVKLTLRLVLKSMLWLAPVGYLALKAHYKLLTPLLVGALTICMPVSPDSLHMCPIGGKHKH
jgi:hypothetical protein